MRNIIVGIIIVLQLFGIGWFVWHDFVINEDGEKITQLNSQLEAAITGQKDISNENLALKEAIQTARRELIELEAQDKLASGESEEQVEVFKEMSFETLENANGQENLKAMSTWAKGVHTVRKEMADGRRWFAEQYNNVLGEKKKTEALLEKSRKETELAKKEQENLKSELQTAKDGLTAKQNVVVEIQGKYNILAENFKNTEKDLANARKDKSTQESRASKAETDLKTANAEISDLKNQLANKQGAAQTAQKTAQDFSKAFDSAVNKAKAATKVEMKKEEMLEYRHYFTRYVSWLAMAGTSDELTKRIGPVEVGRARAYLGAVLNEYSEDKEYEKAQSYMNKAPKNNVEKIYAVLNGYWSLWQKARVEHQQARMELEKESPFETPVENVETELSLRTKSQ